MPREHRKSSKSKLFLSARRKKRRAPIALIDKSKRKKPSTDMQESSDDRSLEVMETAHTSSEMRDHQHQEKALEEGSVEPKPSTSSATKPSTSFATKPSTSTAAKPSTSTAISSTPTRRSSRQQQAAASRVQQSVTKTADPDNAPEDAPPRKIPRLDETDQSAGSPESGNSAEYSEPVGVHFISSGHSMDVDDSWMDDSSQTEEAESLPQQPLKLEDEEDTDVAGQFEMVTVPNMDQWKDGQPLESDTAEPIATTENQLCRLCLKNEGSVPLFQHNGLPRVVAVQIMTVTRVRVSVNDGLPARICESCTDMLQKCFNFKVQCEVADVTLRVKITKSKASPEVVCSDVFDNFTVLKDDMDKTLTKLNTLVSSLKMLEQEHGSSDNTTQAAATAFECVDVKMDDVPLPTDESELKTEIEIEEHTPDLMVVKVEPESIDDSAGGHETQAGDVQGSQASLQANEMDVLQLAHELRSETSMLKAILQKGERARNEKIGGQKKEMGTQTDASGIQLLKRSQGLLQKHTAINSQSQQSDRSQGIQVRDPLRPQMLVGDRQGLPFSQVYVPNANKLLFEGQSSGAQVFMPGINFPVPHMVMHSGRFPRPQMVAMPVQASQVPRTQVLVMPPGQSSRPQTLLQAGQLPGSHSFAQVQSQAQPMQGAAGRKTKRQPGVQRKNQMVETLKSKNIVKTGEILKKQISVQTTEPLRTQTFVQTGDPLITHPVLQTGELLKMHTSVQTGEPLKIQTSVQTGKPLKMHTSVQTGEPLKMQTSVQTGEPLKMQTSVQPGELLKMQTSVQPGEPLKMQTSVQTGEPLKMQTSVQTGELLKMQTSVQTGEPLKMQTSVQTGEPLKSSVQMCEMLETKTSVQISERCKTQTLVQKGGFSERHALEEVGDLCKMQTLSEASESSTMSEELGETNKISAEVRDSSSASAEVCESSSASAEVCESSSASAEVRESSSASAEVRESSSASAEVCESSSASAEVGESSSTSAEVRESSSASAEVRESSSASAEVTASKA